MISGFSPKILISGNYNAFDEGWNGCGVYACSGLYKSETFTTPWYIGSAKDFQDRIEIGNIQTLNRSQHDNKPLQTSWNKYGKENFIWWCLEITKPEFRIEVEQKYLDFYRPFVDEFGGFNIAKEARLPPSWKGKKHSIETLEKMRLCKLGSKNPLFGKKMSEETLKKKSEAMKGEKHYFWGKKHSPEHIKKIADTKRGRKQSQETCNKKAKEFRLIDPTGKLIEGYNMRAFAKENGLCDYALRNVTYGKLKSHKGYTKAPD